MQPGRACWYVGRTHVENRKFNKQNQREWPPSMNTRPNFVSQRSHLTTQNPRIFPSLPRCAGTIEKNLRETDQDTLLDTEVAGTTLAAVQLS
jgi:hypothetical protein